LSPRRRPAPAARTPTLQGTRATIASAPSGAADCAPPSGRRRRRAVRMQWLRRPGAPPAQRGPAHGAHERVRQSTLAARRRAAARTRQTRGRPGGRAAPSSARRLRLCARVGGVPISSASSSDLGSASRSLPLLETCGASGSASPASGTASTAMARRARQARPATRRARRKAARCPSQARSGTSSRGRRTAARRRAGRWTPRRGAAHAPPHSRALGALARQCGAAMPAAALHGCPHGGAGLRLLLKGGAEGRAGRARPGVCRWPVQPSLACARILASPTHSLPPKRAARAVSHAGTGARRGVRYARPVANSE